MVKFKNTERALKFAKVRVDALTLGSHVHELYVLYDYPVFLTITVSKPIVLTQRFPSASATTHYFANFSSLSPFKKFKSTLLR